VVTPEKAAPAVVDRLLRSLPTWFGIASSNAAYVESARELPAYLARPARSGGRDPDAAADPVGVLLVRRHFRHAAEIHLLAVHPSLHRRGAGRALVAALEADLLADGCQFLQVKTLGPSHPDRGYALTRLFHASLGFLPLEEMREFWGPENPCLLMVKALSQPDHPADG
jgi:GNAT superfamily N-acetyltransferase